MSQITRDMCSWLMILIAALCLSSCKEEAAPPVSKTIHLSAPGMHCAGCVNTAETTIRKMAGVDSVHADLSSKDVLVIVDTTKSTRQDLLHVIAHLGFDVAMESDSLVE